MNLTFLGISVLNIVFFSFFQFKVATINAYDFMNCLYAKFLEKKFLNILTGITSFLMNWSNTFLLLMYSKLLKCVIYADKLPVTPGEKSLFTGVLTGKVKTIYPWGGHECPWYLVRIL